MYFNNKK